MNCTRPAGRRHVRDHLGTTISLDAYDAPPAAVESFFDHVRSLEAMLSRFRPDSEISRLTRNELDLDDASPEVREVLARCERLRDLTGGAFDHRRRIEDRVIIDPNAFAKGWIIEQATLRLRMAGSASYFVNAGGDVAVGAPPPDSARWRVGIRHPHNSRAVAAVLEVDNVGIATSGTYERGNHISPRDPGGTTGHLASVTVVGPELATADALATAVFASGRPRPAWWRDSSPYGIVAIGNDNRIQFTENLGDYGFMTGGH